MQKKNLRKVGDCVSPGGIPRINRLNKVKLEAKVIDFVEQKVREV